MSDDTAWSPEQIEQWMAQSIESTDFQNIDEMAEAWGVEVGDYEPTREFVEMEKAGAEILQEVTREEGGADRAVALHESAADISGQRLGRRREVEEWADHNPSEVPSDEEVGVPGTMFVDGRLNQEPNPEYRPYRVRGIYGDPGALEKFYRQEPVVRDSVDSIAEILVAADWRVQAPDSDRVDVDAETMQEWSRYLQRVFTNINADSDRGGWSEYVYDATHGVAKFGFSPFETVWGRMGPERVPRKLKFRNPSTVDRWIMGERQQQLLGVQFNASMSRAGGVAQYTLPAQGPKRVHQRVIVPRISAPGNNWEGVAPARTSAHWIKFKKLLGQIAAATAQEYGVPRTYIRLHESFFSLLEETLAPGGSDEDAKKQVVQDLDQARATDAAIVGLPDGLVADVQSPEGTMPDFESLIRYCDEQIAKPWSNEGSLLGHGNHGSFALAEVKQNKFMQSAPMYARAITAPIDQIIRDMTRERFGPLAEYPEMEMKLNMARDTAEMFERISDLFPPNQPVTTWPQKTRHELARRSGLDEDTFDPDGSAPANPEARSGRRETNPQMWEAPTFQEEGGEDEDDEEEEVDQTSVPLDRVIGEMDRIEEALAERMNEEALGQREAFVDRAQSATTASELQDIADNVAQEWRPRFREHIDRAARRLIREGAVSLIEGLDLDIEGVDLRRSFELQEDAILDDELYQRLPPLPREVGEPLELIRNGIAEEVATRNANHLRDQRSEQIGQTDPSDDDLDALALGTIAGISAGIGGAAFSAGRESVMSGAMGTMQQPPEVEAVRSSMKDRNVCANCRNLDFQNGGPTVVYGTSAYWANHPPKKCLAGPDCRCIYIHRVPRSISAQMEEVLNPPLVFRNPAPLSG